MRRTEEETTVATTNNESSLDPGFEDFEHGAGI